MRFFKTITLAFALFASAKGSAFSGQAALAPSLSGHQHGAHPAVLRVHRESVLADSLQFLLHTTSAQLPKITFIGEPGVDARGPDRDWWQEVNKAIFLKEHNGFFMPNETGEYIQLDLSTPLTAETRANYAAAGRLLAMSISNELPTGVKLPQYILGALLRNGGIEPEDFREEASGQYRVMRFVLAEGEHAIDAFGFHEYDEPAPTVEQFLAEVRESLLPADSLDRIAAIREGFNSLLPIADALERGTIKEIQAQVYGDPIIDIEDLRQHTTPSGSPQDEWLWAWLEASPNSTRRRFIRFLTGRSELPVGGAAALPVKPSIIFSHFAHGLDPISHTAFAQLQLPEYKSPEELAERMNNAILFWELWHE